MTNISSYREDLDHLKARLESCEQFMERKWTNFLTCIVSIVVVHIKRVC